MNIYESLTAVMADCGAVGKDSKNPQQGYKYRGIDAVMNAVNPALTKNKVFIIPEVLELTREERTSNKGSLLIYSTVKVKYTFCAEDGTSVTALVIGEGMDSGDKSINKAMSAAYKYALFQVLCIPTEEMVDSSTASPESQPKAAPATPTTPAASSEPSEAIGAQAAATLATVLKKSGVDIEKLCQQKKVAGLADLTMQQYGAILRQLEGVKK